MRTDDSILARFDQLIAQGARVLTTRRSRSGHGVIVCRDDAVDVELSHQWGMSCLSLIERAFGAGSSHATVFRTLMAHFEDFNPVAKAQGILRAARDDLSAGALFEVRRLIEAEVFDEFLEQARSLHSFGYAGPAAVLATAVLEDGLRKLCDRNAIALLERPKLDQMNADLAKAGVYSKLTQKQITAIADIRNNAAHGRWDAFSPEDVQSLIQTVQSFMQVHFA